MTVQEMKDEFLVGYDKVASLAAPGFEDSEISHFLSQAQERFVKQHYHPRGNKYQEGFDESEKRKKDLSNILRQTQPILSVDQTDVVGENSFLYDMPEDYWLTTMEWLITDDTCNNRKKVIPKTHDEYFEEVDNPFEKPDSSRAWRLEISPNGDITRHEIITNGDYNITSYNVRYVKQLTDISITNDVDCELHPMTHREIVNMAVTIALENQQEPRTQTHAQLGERAE